MNFDNIRGTATTVLTAFGLKVLGAIAAWIAGRWLIDLFTRPKFTSRFRTPLHEMYGGLAALCRPKLLIIATLIAIPAWGAECIGFA